MGKTIIVGVIFGFCLTILITTIIINFIELGKQQERKRLEAEKKESDEINFLKKKHI